MSYPQSPGAPTGKSLTDYTSATTYEKTRLPVSEATTLIPEAYYCDQFYQLEQQQVWGQGWVCVGYTSQVANPGDLLVTEVAGQSILIVRDKSGQLNAFHNVCRHRGARLIDDEKHCSVIRCPYHGWGYGLNGRLLGAPYFQGMDVPPQAAAQFRIRAEEQGKFCKEDHGLIPVHVDTWGSLVFLNLAEESTPLSEWLGDLPERFSRYPLDQLQLIRRKEYSMKANWKLVAENFMEYYHLPSVHPELCNISGFADHQRCQGPGMYTGMCTSPLTEAPNTVRLDLPSFTGLNETEAQSAYFIMLFPNIALWLFPNHLLTLLFRPQGSGVTLESMDMLVHPSILDEANLDHRLDEIMKFWDLVNRQDIGIVEVVQQGLQSSSYRGGRMCYDFEEPVHRFQNCVIDRILGIHRIPQGDPEEQPLVSTVS